MGNMSGVIIRRNAESGVISERFPELGVWATLDPTCCIVHDIRILPEYPS